MLDEHSEKKGNIQHGRMYIGKRSNFSSPRRSIQWAHFIVKKLASQRATDFLAIVIPGLCT